MRFPLLASALAALCLAATSTAQVQVFGGSTERHSTSQILFGQGIAAGIAIEHGQPVWKDSYDGMLDQLKGKLLRLGANWWTTMTTSVPLEFGKTKVPAGSYLLGLHCDDAGTFSLTFLDANKGLKAGALPFPMQGKMNWKPDMTAKLEMHKDAAKEVQKKMKMMLKVDGKNLDNGLLTLAWGKHKLTAKFAVKPAMTPKSDK
ncbi:MAG: DUF2911 domain-containing protein [bacterium]|nr:DUF2911 domain-containing protein [bacterium]